MKWKILALLLFSPQIAVAAGSSGVNHGPLNIRTINGAVSNYPYQLKITNGSLTDNGDGTMTLTISGGSSCETAGNPFCLFQGGGAYFEFDGTNLCLFVNGVSKVCYAESVATFFLLLEDGTNLLLEDGGKIKLE